MKKIKKLLSSKRMEKFKSPSAKRWLFVLAVFVVASIFIPDLRVVYLFVVLGSIFYLAKQSQREKGGEPWVVEEKKKELQQLQAKADIIKKHLETKDDIEAKLLLNETEEEIKRIKNEYGIE